MGIGIDISFDGTSLSFGEIYEKPPRNKGKSLMSTPDDYVVIDIETTGLSPDYNEIIELSALKCHNDEVVENFSILVKPEDEIDEYITELTGITNEMVKDAPNIEQALPQYIDFIGDNIVIGHNVNFDINFIYDNWYYISDKEFKNDFVDLLRLSRRLFPNLNSHKLSALSEHFNICSQPIHRGLDDCFATFECYINCKNYIQENNIDISLYEKKLDLRKITSDNTDFDTSHPLYNAKCVFTGRLERLTREDAAKLVVNVGGQCENGVTKKTNFLILGNNDYCSTIKGGKSSKQKKAEKLILEGQDLKIIPENVFYDMIFDN